MTNLFEQLWAVLNGVYLTINWDKKEIRWKN